RHRATQGNITVSSMPCPTSSGAPGNTGRCDLITQGCYPRVALRRGKAHNRAGRDVRRHAASVHALDQEKAMDRSMGRNMAWNYLKRLTCAVALVLPLALSAAQAQDRVKVAIGQINNWENQAPTLG